MDLEDLLPKNLGLNLKSLELEDIAKMIMDLLNATYLSIDYYTFDPPIINEDPPFVILRFRDSIFTELPINFHVLSGILEKKIDDYLSLNNIAVKIKVDVNSIHVKQKLVDMKIEIHI